MSGAHHASVATALVLVLTGCNQEPPCKVGKLSADWEKSPLKELVEAGSTVCEVPAAESATHGQFWLKSKSVHDANMANVDRAQDNGWDRTSDNWYSSKGDFNTPKWSEFRSKDGARLRIDVKEANGGALVDVKLTPKP